MQHKLTAKRFWQIAEKRLKLTDLPPLPSTKERTQFLAALPERLAREPVQDWLKRCQVGSAKIIPFPQPKRLLPLAEITRLAADSGLERYPLPDPGRFLESDDGRFRLKIIGEVPETIRIMLQTLGFAADEFAEKRLGIASAETPPVLLVDLVLDEDGDGEGTLPDILENRRALLRPLIVQVEE